jgi:hypothetical protein
MLIAIARGLGRHPVVLVNALLLLLLATAGVRRSVESFATAESSPADLFIRSIVLEDGDLGWKQLCPSLQQDVPRTVMQELTTTQRAISSAKGMTLTVEHVADRPRPGGGEIRFYLGTLRTADGSTGQKTYIISTQVNGCVENIE